MPKRSLQRRSLQPEEADAAAAVAPTPIPAEARQGRRASDDHLRKKAQPDDGPSLDESLANGALINSMDEGDSRRHFS